MHHIACEVESGATCNFTRHIACKGARITMCDCMCKYCIQGCNYCYMFFNVERNIAYKVASDATSKVTTAKTRHITHKNNCSEFLSKRLVTIVHLQIYLL